MNNNTLRAGHSLKNGEYRIIETLGQGGFGITYLAEQTALGRRVAVKEFFMKENCNRDEQTSRVSVPSTGSRELVEKFRNKFLREARMIATLDNPHIVRIHDVFEENGTAYYVMEHLGGGSLADRVRQSGPMPQTEALGYIRQAADALIYLHGRNILHFDVKPSNILLGQSGQAVLIDFGISKHYDEAGSQTSSTPVGLSKGYAPLEQYQQSEISTFTPATDIYSLGATLYFLLIGQTPPSASEVNEDGLPPLPGGIDAPIREAITKAMAPRRRERPQSVREFLRLFDTPAPTPVPEPVPTPAPVPTIEDEETEFLRKNKQINSYSVSSKTFSVWKHRNWFTNLTTICAGIFLAGLAIIMVAILFLWDWDVWDVSECSAIAITILISIGLLKGIHLIYKNKKIGVYFSLLVLAVGFLIADIVFGVFRYGLLMVMSGIPLMLFLWLPLFLRKEKKSAYSLMTPISTKSEKIIRTSSLILFPLALCIEILFPQILIENKGFKDKNFRWKVEFAETYVRAHWGWTYDKIWLGNRYNWEDDYTNALLWYKKAADEGSAAAQNKIGDVYRWREDGGGNKEEAIKWYRTAYNNPNATDSDKSWAIDRLNEYGVSVSERK